MPSRRGGRDVSPESRSHPGHVASPEQVPIREYAVIGDMQTCALVSRGGSVDWLCLPRFDSPSCFTALLGSPQHGRWLLGPVVDDGAEVTTTRRYVGDTFVLETTHETPTGVVRVVDAMPTHDGRHDIIRTVEGVRGTVRVRHEWIVRFGYGKVVPWVSRSEGPGGPGDRVITAVAGPDLLVLRGTRLPTPVDGSHVDEFDVAAGERHTFSTTWLPSHLPVPADVASDETVERTRGEWQAWADRCAYDGPYRDVVIRSLLVLRLLTDSTTGGIVAAATTSLPEDFGGERNWDYRYCWLRDASLTLDALIAYGFVEETALWRRWLIRAVAGDPEDLQIMYAVDGGRELPERTLDHLPGYAGSTPVRVGNGAVDQRQSDVLGEMMTALASGRDAGLEEDERSWHVQCALVDGLAEHWQEPDHGLWEIRGEPQFFTHSRVMMWTAFDRAVTAVERGGLEADDECLERWRRVRDGLREEVLTRGWDAERGTFVQHYGTRELDASLLLLPVVGFLPGDDPRVLGTIKAVEEDLLRDGLVLRYRTGSGVDGLSGDEHPFLACSFWLVGAYAGAGEVAKATALMDRLVGVANDVGLLSEEYDPVADRLAGNFPQAFSHLALIRAAQALEAVAVEGRHGGDVRPTTRHFRFGPDGEAVPLRRPADDLAAVDVETGRLLRTLRRLDAEALAGASRCEGWTRGHVVAHLARNADALHNLTRAALTGERIPMYASPEARDADIEAGADRPAETLLHDVTTTAERWRAAAAPLATEADWLDDVTVEVRGGAVVPALDLPLLRLREVVLHHLDLDAGFDLARLDPGLQLDLLLHQAARLARDPAFPGVRMTTDEGDEIIVGDSPAYSLGGRRAALLGWTTRGLTDDVTSATGDFPTLPFGG